jgi:phosphatidylserine/phosphatidylglycerophosphate/cardiolipin synthase-like enzyme
MPGMLKKMQNARQRIRETIPVFNPGYSISKAGSDCDRDSISFKVVFF